jgi:hypothetical protein
MKQLKKKLIAVMLLFALVACVNMPYISTYAASSDNGVATGQYATWKNNAIVYPSVGQLVAAGPIYLQWNKIDNAAKYYVYIDDQLKGSVNATNENVIEYEIYSTSVATHTVKIVAELKDNTKITANIRTFYISKKGLGSGMVNKVEESGLSWYYHWSTDPVSGANPKIQFVPMLWGNWGHDWLTNPENKKYKTILGFNEPDFADQSNVSVDAAIGAWPDFMNSGLRVGSPATAIAAPWSSWFSSFMDKVNGDSSLDVDFIAVHCYLDGTYPETFLKMIDDCYQKYHKPIWITEFGIAEWSQGKWNGNDPSAVNQVSEFMKKVLPELDKRDYVERYAWFPFDPTDKYGGASGLYNVNTGKLNSLGSVYRSLGNPSGYVLPNLDGSIISGSIPQDVVVDDGLGNDTTSEGNLALNKNVTVSSIEGNYLGANAVDGNTNSRWSSNAADNQWISIDLGSTKSVSKVALNWEVAYAKGYKIEVSTDGSNWTSVYQTTNSDGGKDEVQFNSVNARYVRVCGTERGTVYGISLWELGIY